MKNSVRASFMAVYRNGTPVRWVVQRLPQDDEFGRYHAFLYRAAWDRIEPLNEPS